MFLRFTLLSRDADSRRKQGILVAAHILRDEGDVSATEHQQLRLVLDWFNKNLSHPSCLGEEGNHRALSWFKPEAREPLMYMRTLTELLRAHGIEVEVHKSRDPGLVLYEDQWQIVAKPRKGVRGGW